MKCEGITLIAWGNPSDRRTFSGIARSVRNALQGAGRLSGELSLKAFKLPDVIDGALRLRIKRDIKLEFSRTWMWTQRGRSKISGRIARRIVESKITGPILQVGTLADLRSIRNEHYMLTDMTIKQAVEAGQFPVSEISERRLREIYDLEREVVTAANHIFTLSEWARKSVIQDLGVDENKVSVVYAAPNIEAAESSVKYNPRGPILFVGIDWHRKGGPLLIDAFRLLRSRIGDAELTIIGCSPKVNVEGVKVLGFLDKNDPEQRSVIEIAYQTASCFCLPSKFDPFPIVLLEAATFGLPCVAIDNGSRREAIVHGKTGLLCPVGSPESLCETLIEILRKPDASEIMGLEAKKRAAELFTWEKVISRMLKVVDRG